MAVTQAQLLIHQGSTFRQTFACSLADHSIADIQVWATGGGTFTLSVGLRGDSNFKAVASGTVSLAGNNVTLDIDEAVTALISDLEGRFVVEVTNNTDRWRIMQGAWALDRDTL